MAMSQNESTIHEYNAFDISWQVPVGTQMKLSVPRLILGLRPANKRRRYFVTPSFIVWVQACTV